MDALIFTGTVAEVCTTHGHFGRLAYGNFDIILDHFSRTSQLHSTQHAPCDMLYFVPILIGR